MVAMWGLSPAERGRRGGTEGLGLHDGHLCMLVGRLRSGPMGLLADASSCQWRARSGRRGTHKWKFRIRPIWAGLI